MDTNPRPLLNTLDPLTRRERALEARLESGRWGVIEAVVRDSSPSPRAEGVADQARILVLRLQVPIQPPIETPIEPIAGANGVAPPATDRAKDQAP